MQHVDSPIGMLNLLIHRYIIVILIYVRHKGSFIQFGSLTSPWTSKTQEHVLALVVVGLLMILSVVVWFYFSVTLVMILVKLDIHTPYFRHTTTQFADTNH